MSLFFYGAIEVRGDAPACERALLRIAERLGWTLSFGAEIDGHGAPELFQVADDPLVFELVPVDAVYEALYGDQDGDRMVAHYRQVARDLGVEGWAELAFGADASVDEAYRRSWRPLPIIAFLDAAFHAFPDRRLLFSLDEGFENRFRCEDVVGSEEDLLRAAWSTIAWGYGWPNLRLRRDPPSGGPGA